MVIAGGVLHELLERLLSVLLLFVVGVVFILGQIHPRALGEEPDRLYVGEGLHLHYEGDDVAARTAAETVIELPLRVDVHRRVFVGVEWADAGVARPLFDKRDVLRDYAHDVAFEFQLVDESVGKQCHFCRILRVCRTAPQKRGRAA